MVSGENNLHRFLSSVNAASKLQERSIDAAAGGGGGVWWYTLQ